MWRSKTKEWFKRYSIPLILATLAAIISATIIKILTGNNIIAGILATWIDNITFYGYIYIKDLRKNKEEGPRITNIFKQLRNMIFEFGPAEYLDSFLIRPFYLSFSPYLIDNYQIAILLGSIFAEITYFIPVVIFYEIRKKAFED